MSWQLGSPRNAKGSSPLQAGNGFPWKTQKPHLSQDMQNNRIPLAWKLSTLHGIQGAVPLHRHPSIAGNVLEDLAKACAVRQSFID